MRRSTFETLSWSQMSQPTCRVALQLLNLNPLLGSISWHCCAAASRRGEKAASASNLATFLRSRRALQSRQLRSVFVAAKKSQRARGPGPAYTFFEKTKLSRSTPASIASPASALLQGTQGQQGRG